MSAEAKSAPLTVARGAALILAGLAAARILNWAYRIVLARAGGMGEFGVLFLAVSTIAVAGTVASLGLEYGVARFAPLYLGGGDRASLRACLRFSLLLALASGAAAAGVLYLTAVPLAGAMSGSDNLAAALRVSALCLPFYVTGRVLVKTVVAFQKIEYRVGVYQVFNPLVKLLLTLVLLSFGLGAVGALEAYLAAEVLSSATLWLILEKKIFPVMTAENPRGAASAFSPRALMAYSLPLFLAGFLDVVMSYTDAFMTGHFMDENAVGLYGAAATLASVVALGTELVNPMFLSIVTRQWAAGEHEAVRDTVINNNRWFLYLTLPLLAGSMFLARPLMALLWGQAFAAGALALAILVVGRFMYCIENTSLLLLSMHGAGGYILGVNLAVAGLNVALNWWLIPLFGIEGAAAATCLSLTLHAGLMLIGARLKHRGQGMRVVFWRVAAAAALPVGLLHYLPDYLGSGWFGVLASGLVYLAVYALLLNLFRVFSPEDRQVWRALAGRLRGNGAAERGR
ncbi:oligosaccharide flippase family protein [bacterium]|nr:oligosaccharide flippase family protein [bacterium]